MPAALPGSTAAQNKANPSLGKAVIFCPLSGPKGSPLDARTFGAWDAVSRLPAVTTDPNNISTGALQTGIGISAEPIMAVNPSTNPQTAPGAIFRAGFEDNLIPGEAVTAYAAGGPPPVVSTQAVDSTMMYIGGGRCDANTNGVAAPDPYTAGVQLLSAGNGGTRDAGAGPAFTGFGLKMVTAAGTVAVGAAVETGFVNRSTRSLVSGESVFGSSAAASAAPA
jgi:hypothetical protein